MRIFAMTPCKNEAGRYLEAMLSWVRPMVDEIAFYDDRSDDDSVDIAEEFGAKVKVRGEFEPSFLEHEGKYRANVWKHLEDSCRPVQGDWILAVDCDEFLVAHTGREATDGSEVIGPLRMACTQAAQSGVVGIVLPVPEVFAIQAGRPFVRMDGYWGSIAGPRLFAYKPEGDYNMKAMGSGAEPLYVSHSPLERNMRHGLSLMHYGYADQADVAIKYERYNSLVEHGHSNSHVQSIPNTPYLETWHGPIPNVYRGRK